MNLMRKWYFIVKSNFLKSLISGLFHLVARTVCQCEKIYKSKYAMLQHVKIVHKAQKIHVCDLCEKKFKYEKTLEIHVDFVHNNMKKFTCNHCNQEFFNQKSLTNHITYQHSDDAKKKDVRKCDICNKLLEAKYLTKHIKSVYS